MSISNQNIFKLISVFIAFLIIALLLKYIGISSFISKINEIPSQYFLCAFILYGTSWYIRTKRTSFLLPLNAKISILLLFQILIAGYALNVVLPAKLGEIASIGFLKVRGLSLEISAMVILQSRILDILGLVCSTLPIFILYANAIPQWANIITISGMILFCIPHLIILWDSKRKFPEIIFRIPHIHTCKLLAKIFQIFQTSYYAYFNIVRNKRVFCSSAILSVIIWFFEGMTCYILSIPLNTTITIFISIFAVSIANLGKIIPATPGSIGIYEALLSGILIQFDVIPSVAISIAILDHLLKNIFVLLTGLPAGSHLGSQIFKK